MTEFSVLDWKKSSSSTSHLCRHLCPHSEAVFPLKNNLNEGPFLYQHDKTPHVQSQVCTEMVFPLWCGKTWLVCSQVLTLTPSDADWVRPYRSTPVSDLTDARVGEWEEIPAASLQNLVEIQKRGGCYSSRWMLNTWQIKGLHDIGVKILLQQHYHKTVLLTDLQHCWETCNLTIDFNVMSSSKSSAQICL